MGNTCDCLHPHRVFDCRDSLHDLQRQGHMNDSRTEQPCHVAREVYEAVKAQRDHWKERAEAVSSLLKIERERLARIYDAYQQMTKVLE